ncbi:DNA polymerase-4 [Alteromonadaceae bacterium Bs31]|nr:DNA polymerase-4 [Alteromonadaceae bacterium Bs31]
MLGEISMRKIIHVDADCFYAALEMRENPALRDVPLAVGGNPDGRGVVATCNYLARQYGVRSAMASANARRLCPNLVFVKPNFNLYKRASEEMREIFAQFSDLIEPASLDEAYLDVSESEQCRGSATLIASQIRQLVYQEIGITVSAGIAPVKFLAKIASDWNKPNGMFTVSPAEVATFCLNLPLTKLPGVGKATSTKLARLGLFNCRDILQCDKDLLVSTFGKYSYSLIQMSEGKDSRLVKPNHARKSISIERTYSADLDNQAALAECLPELMDGLRQRYRNLPKQYTVLKKYVKLKFDNFQHTTMEMTLSQNADPLCFDDFQRLMTVGWCRQKRAVRLMGLGFRLAEGSHSSLQLPLPFPCSGL